MHDFSNQSVSNNTPNHGQDTTFWEIASWIAVVALVVLLVLTYAWLQIERLQTKYRVQELTQERGKLLEAAGQIKAEYSSLTNPAAISRKAEALGLLPSQRDQVLIVEAEEKPATGGMMANSKERVRSRR